jgi:hypothetical protein
MAEIDTPFAQKSETAESFQTTGDTDSDKPDTSQSVTWTASEFIAHDKTIGWYLGLIVVALLLATGIYALTKDMVSAAVIIVAALFLAYYGSHQPRQLEYRLDGQGIKVGERHYGYSSFRSFSVIPEGAFSSIVFMPLKRFALPLTLYDAPDDEDKIVKILSNQLPLEERRPDAIDSLMRRIRF